MRRRAQIRFSRTAVTVWARASLNLFVEGLDDRSETAAIWLKIRQSEVYRRPLSPF